MLPERLAHPITAITTVYSGNAAELESNFLVRCPAILNGGTPGDEQATIGLWDTGATNCGISAALAEAMELTPVSRAITMGVHGPEVVYVYYVDILVPGTDLIFRQHRVSEVKMLKHGLLIGMDVISRGDFSITHKDDETIFSFRYPTLRKSVDYLAEVNEYKARHEAKAQKEQAKAASRKFLSSKRNHHGR